jgi:hypothetical protein
MPTRIPRPSPPATRVDRPAVDEWGIYDPSKAGLEAVFDRLEARRRAATDPEAKSIAASMEDAKRLQADEPQPAKPTTK